MKENPYNQASGNHDVSNYEEVKKWKNNKTREGQTIRIVLIVIAMVLTCTLFAIFLG